MTVTVDITTPAVIPSGTSTSFGIGTLVSSDLVVLVLSRGSSGAFASFTVGGVTPTTYGSWQNGTGGTRVIAYTATGLTGSTSVAISTSTTTNVHITAYVVHGLTNVAITAFAISTWSATATSSGVDEGPASLSAGSGQFAIFAATAAGSTPVVFPSNPTPSSGWTTDRSNSTDTGGHAAAHYTPTAAGTVQANINAPSNRPIGTVMLVLGDEVTASPLVSTFVGWGNPIF